MGIISQNFNRDRLVMVPRDDAVRAAYEALSALQSLPPHEFVAGMAVLFAATADRVGLDPEYLHGLGRRIIREQGHHDKANLALQSLRDFAGIRIKGEAGVGIA